MTNEAKNLVLAIVHQHQANAPIEDIFALAGRALDAAEWRGEEQQSERDEQAVMRVLHQVYFSGQGMDADALITALRTARRAGGEVKE